MNINELSFEDVCRFIRFTLARDIKSCLANKGIWNISRFVQNVSAELCSDLSKFTAGPKLWRFVASRTCVDVDNVGVCVRLLGVTSRHRDNKTRRLSFVNSAAGIRSISWVECDLGWKQRIGWNALDVRYVYQERFSENIYNRVLHRDVFVWHFDFTREALKQDLKQESF